MLKKGNKQQTMSVPEWKGYLFFYTIAFCITFCIVYSPFLIEGKSFICTGHGGDGRTQEYPALVYIGRYLRDVVKSILNGRGLRTFDINLAMGADIVSLHNYGIFNPIAMLSVFVPTRYTEYFLDFTVWLQMYLAGLSFSGLCFHFRKKKIDILTGSIIYVFSGYYIWAAAAHPTTTLFVMIEMPLCIWGAELIIENKRPYLFILSVLYSVLCGFYYFYMITIMLIIFVAVRCMVYYQKENRKILCLVMFKGVLCYLLGIGIAAPVLLPSILTFLQGGRAGFTITRQVNLMSYDPSWYRSVLATWIAPLGNNTMAAITPLAVIVLFTLKWEKRYKVLRWLLWIGLAILLIPFGGMVMNGWQYPTDRWIFGLNLLLAYIVVELLPTLKGLTYRQGCLCLLITVVYGIFFLMTDLRTENNLFGLVALTFTVLCLISTSAFFPVSSWMKKHAPYLLLAFVIFNVGLNGVYKYSEKEGGEINNYPSAGSRTRILEDAIEVYIKPYITENSGRVDSTSVGTNHNMVWQVPTMNGYWSVMNGNVTTFWKRMEIPTTTMQTRIKSTDQRTMLDTLMSTKYFADSVNKTSYVPYGYKPVVEIKEDVFLYENQYALPWAYTYDNYIKSENVNVKNVVELQETMMQTIVLDEQLPDFSVGTPQCTSADIPYEAVYDNCTWEDGVLTVNKVGGKMTLQFDMPECVEGYVSFVDFDINDSSLVSFSPVVADSNISKEVFIASERYNYYDGRDDYLVNLGYQDERRYSCTITFPNKGVFKLGELHVIAQPMRNYENQVEKLRKEPLENIQFEGNHVSGTVDLSKNKILCISIPYSKGWTAMVDGEKKRILHGNYMFMCIPLTVGHHDIEFTYRSPGLKLGILVSLVSLCGVCGMLASNHCRGRQRKKKS